MISRADYVRRLIDQLARFLVALLGVRKARDGEELRRTLEQAAAELLGMEYRILVRFDPDAVAQALGDALKLVVLARLVVEGADHLAAAGDVADAAERRAFALALCERAAASRPRDPDVARLVAEVRARAS